MVKVKLLSNVKINGRHLDPEIRRIIDAARLHAPEMTDNTVWITSAADGKHSQGSRHYTSEAFDIRVKNVKGFKWSLMGDWKFNQRVADWAEAIRFELGSKYDVVYGDAQHLDHIHCEFDPKIG